MVRLRYRKEGMGWVWMTFPTAAEAERAAEELRAMGYEVEVFDA